MFIISASSFKPQRLHLRRQNIVKGLYLISGGTPLDAQICAKSRSI